MMTTSMPDDPSRLLADLDFVRGLARQLCRDDAHAAEDLAQDAVVRALETPPGNDKNRRGWLATVLRNLSRNRRRGDRRRRERECSTGITAATAAPSTIEVVASEQQRSLVVRAVLALPESYREAILLRHFRGLDVKQSARQLGLSETAMRTRLSRAIAMLRERLDAEHGGNRDKWLLALLPLTMPQPNDAVAVAGVATATSPGAKLLVAAAALLLTFAAAVALGFGDTSGNIAAPNTVRHTAADADVAATRSDRTVAAAIPEPAMPRRIRVVTAPAATAGIDALVGFVRDRQDRGIVDAEVRVWAEIGEDTAGAERIALATPRSGPDGRFAIPLAPLAALSRAAYSQVEIWASITADGYGGDMASISLSDAIALIEHQPAIDVRLARGRYICGRVVDSRGQPTTDAIVFLRSDVTHDVDTDASNRDGAFWFECGSSFAPGDRVALFAAHPDHGISALQHVHIIGDGNVQTAPFVLQPAPTRIEGRVTWADSTPACNVELTFDPIADAASTQPRHDDLRLLEARIRIANAWRRHETLTDLDGRYRLAFALAGSYRTDDGQRIEVQRGVAHRFDYRMPQLDEAQLILQIVDRDGRALPEAGVGIYQWTGDAAVAAEARFATDGPSHSVLRSAQDHQRIRKVGDGVLHVPLDSFLVIEAACHDSGPAYTPCRIETGRSRADVRIELTGDDRRASLRVVVRDPDDHIVQPVWIKLRGGETGRGLPIPLPGLTTEQASPVSGISGDWHAVPEHGLLRNLPTGTFEVHLLPGPGPRPDRIEDVAFSIERHVVTLAADETTDLHVTTTPGHHLVFDLQADQLGDDNLPLRAVVTTPDGRKLRHALLTAAGGRVVRLTNGRCRVRTTARFAPGRYDVRIEGSRQLLDADAGDARPWRRTIDLDAATAPAVVRLRLP